MFKSIARVASSSSSLVRSVESRSLLSAGFASKTPFECISTPNAPKAIGPYSQGVKANGFLFVSGCIGFVPETGDYPANNNVETQTEQALKNMTGILEAGGSSLNRVVKTTVFLADMADYPKVNQIYAEYFKTSPPARSCIAVKTLPRNALFEVECVALAEPTPAAEPTKA